jgi:ribosomal protein S8
MKRFFDFNSSLKNAYDRKRKFFTCNVSNLIICIIRILYKEGFINGFIINPKNPKKVIVFLKYNQGNSVFKSIMPISKPSQRIFVKSTFVKNKIFKEGCFFLSSNKKGIFLTMPHVFLNNNFFLGGEILAKLVF